MDSRTQTEQADLLKETMILLLWSFFILMVLFAVQNRFLRRRTLSSSSSTKNKQKPHSPRITRKKVTSNRNKVVSNYRDSAKPTSNPDYSMNKNRPLIQRNSLIDEEKELRSEISKSQKILNQHRKKSRKEIQEEFQAVSKLQSQLKNDLNDLKGLLSSLQELSYQKSRDQNGKI